MSLAVGAHAATPYAPLEHRGGCRGFANVGSAFAGPAFLIAAFIAPTRRSHFVLLAAVALEGMVGACVFFASLLRF